MNYALIFAGGTGSRMNSKSLPKQFLKVYGKPVIVHTLEKFEQCEAIDAIVVVILKGWESHLEDLVKQYHLKKVIRIVPGGDSGQESIYNGLKEMDSGIVVIHDGVRPFINDEIIIQNIELAKEKQVAITCATAKETFAYVENNYIKHVIKRENSFIAKAPQTFNLDLIKSAHHKAIAENKFSFIDSCMIVKHYYPELDFPIVFCGPENIKITTQEDFYLAKAMFSIEEDEQLYRGSE